LGEKSVVQVHFLLGPAGSGKTFRCLAEIRDALRGSAGPDTSGLILLAPRQATFQLERQLLADPALLGYTRLHIFSFERLARFVLDALGVTAPSGMLAEEGRVMVLRALLLRHEGGLKLLRESARRPGFTPGLSGLLGEFQQHRLTPAGLHALAQRSDLRRELRDKLRDLALLFEAYVNWLAERELQDGNRLLDAATESLKSKAQSPKSAGQPGTAPSSAFHLPSSVQVSSLWLDGFAEMTPQELDLLAAVLSFCERATLAFCLDEPSAEGIASRTSWLSLWGAVGKTYQQCRQRLVTLPGCEISVELLKRESQRNRFSNSPALQHLEATWSETVRGFGVPSRLLRDGQAQSCAQAVPPCGAELQTKCIRIAACPNAEAEVTLAAREILRFVRGGGRFRDAAVLVRNLDGYHPPLARAFRRYGIPFFLDRRESVAHHPLAELTRSALRTVAFDWGHNDWFAALKAGFSPADETEIDQLENEALARGWRGAKWREPLQIADDPDLARSLERLRKTILPPFENFARQLAHFKKMPTGEQLAEAVRELWDELGVEKALEKWSLAGPGKSPSANRQSSIHATVWEQINAWLDNAALAFSDEPLLLRDWLPILEAGLANLTVGVVPPALDQVLIGAVDRARNPDLKLALVLGVNEQVFPAAPAAPAILTDADREELGRAVAPGPNLRDRLARERYYGYIAFTRASEKLVVTFARRDTEGKTLNPSPFIAQLQRMLPELEVEEFKGEVSLGEAEHVSEIAPLLIEMRREFARETNPPLPASGHPLPALRGEGRGEGFVKNWPELRELPAVAELVQSLAALREPDPAERLLPALAESLFGPVLRVSVSRLEEFAACPFRFFVHTGLRAEERKKFELDARERGSFQHEVLKIFHEQLVAAGKRWRDLSPDEARERVGKIAAGLMANYRDGLLRDTAQSQFEARALTASLQDFIGVTVSWMRGQYGFDPAAAEVGFGFEGGAPAWELDLGSGRRLALRGRIDRIDLGRDSGCGGAAPAVVMDYKSGSRKLDAVLVEHGIQLQLLAYLNVLRHWENPSEILGVKKLLPAGVFYVNLAGGYESGGTRSEVLATMADARKRAYRHTGRFDAGMLPQLDRAGAADQFNYKLNQDGSLRKGSTEALPRAEFEQLLDRVETQLGRMGRAIFSGAAQVDPYRKGLDTPCAYCDYRAACRIDPWTHPYRVLRAAAM
jgi:ATP-dependent helicase/nuclease subunit B